MAPYWTSPAPAGSWAATCACQVNTSCLAIAATVQSVGLRLTVADDGRGIAREPSATGFGMTSMQERAERIGASLTIVTAPRNGTEVVLAWDPASLPTQVHGNA